MRSLQRQVRGLMTKVSGVTRVPLIIGAPLTLPGTISIRSHCIQSIGPPQLHRTPILGVIMVKSRLDVTNISRMLLNLVQLGRVPYIEALTLQQQLVELRHQQRIGNTLLLLEHPPVLTLGRNSRPRQRARRRPTSRPASGVEIHEINRGGDVTYHGPGQARWLSNPRPAQLSLPGSEQSTTSASSKRCCFSACASYGIVTQSGSRKRTGVWTVLQAAPSPKRRLPLSAFISRGASPLTALP